MNRLLTFAALLLAPLFAWGASPSLESFDQDTLRTNNIPPGIIRVRFDVKQMSVTGTNGITITNVVGVPGSTNLVVFNGTNTMFEFDPTQFGIATNIAGGVTNLFVTVKNNPFMTNIWDYQTLAVYGSFMTPATLSTNLVSGTNDINTFNQGFIYVTGASTNFNDSQIRLNTGNGQGAHLWIENYSTNSAFMLQNGSELWDDPTSHVILNGTWIPTLQGEALELIQDGRGWREVGRLSWIGGQNLWEITPAGILQPINHNQSFQIDAGTATINPTVASGGLSMLTVTSSDANIYIRGDNGLIRMDKPAYGYLLDINPENGTAPAFLLDSPTTYTPRIQWLVNHTNIFTVAGDTGYSGTGTKFLSDDGTYKSGIGGGTTINPTDGYIPYRQNATTFQDSPWYRIAAQDMGFGSTTRFLYGDNHDNLSLGHLAGRDVTGGDFYNIAIGGGAGMSNTTSTANLEIGYLAGKGVTTGNYNVLLGWQAGMQKLNNNNVIIGSDAGSVSGSYGGTTLVGDSAGRANQVDTTVALGASSLFSHTTGIQDTSVGYEAGKEAVGLSHSTLLGYRAGYVFGGGGLTNQTNVIVIGANAQATNDNEIVIGNANNTKAIFPITSYTGAGTKALFDDGTYKTVTSGGDTLWYSYIGSSSVHSYGMTNNVANFSGSTTNVVLVGDAAYANSGDHDQFRLGTNMVLSMQGIHDYGEYVPFQLRVFAGDPNSTHWGTANIYMGFKAGESQPFDDTSAGFRNLGIGIEPLKSITTGYDNYAIGFQSLVAATDAWDNTAYGYQTLTRLVSGHGNVAMGNSALDFIEGNENTGIGNLVGGNVTTGHWNSFYGSHSGMNSTGVTNVTGIGANVEVTANNRVVIGDANVTAVYAGSESAAALIHGNGYSSVAVDSAASGTSAGWTNTFGKAAVIRFDGTTLTYNVFNNALTPIYTNTVSVGHGETIIQTGGKILFTGGSVSQWVAAPF